MEDVKKKLLAYCQQKTEKNIKAIGENLDSINQAKLDETKSSVGDKYETSRAMMQIEEEKNQKQLAQAQATKDILSKINLNKAQSEVLLGSLIITDHGTYFASIGLGKVELEGEIYFCISLHSPIGAQLKNKTVGDTIQFNRKSITIKAIY